ncbi:hypothetical protein [Nocardioides sp.]|uniref:hypothetical protein n=1 Tax=Nocardioides sp. TaxID=35761 RepID=UPI002633FD7C|nr:hypothetical protein [Nocardioides sp.]
MARRTLKAALAGALAGATLVLPGLGLGPAQAAPRVTIANADGQAVADPTYATTVRVKGRGFQSIKGGFGGLYVAFGTVKGTWKPSKGGKTGHDYFYVPDSEAKDNQGFLKFVSYPGADTSSAANGGVVSADGTWSTTLLIPGVTFQALDRNGTTTTIDCRKVTCGVLTFGAHGVANAANESFTPIRFASLTAASSTPSATASSSSSAGTSSPALTAIPDPTATAAPGSGTTATGTAGTGTATSAALTVDRATAVAGRVLTFTGSGLRPGEQVALSLDDGVAAVGPLSAGASGEVAGVLQLPLDLEAGTHVLKLTAAVSGATPTVSFPISAASAPVAAATSPSHRAAYVFAAIGLLVLAGAGLFVALRGRGPRRRSVAGAPDAA